MKILPVVSTCVLLIMTITATAQPAMKKEGPDDMLALHKTPESAVPNNMASFRDIPINAVRDFKSTWQHIDHETWYKIHNGYRARFNEAGILYLVTYNKKGKWLNTMRQYDETKLNREVRARVKSVYFDYNIILVEEIEERMKPLTYVIHLDDKVSFKNIRICDREMEVMSEIRKL